MFIEFVQKYTDDTGISLNEISRRAGLAPNYLSEALNGKRPGWKGCQKLARYFGIPVNEMLYMVGHIQRPEDESRMLSEEIAAALERKGKEVWKRVLRAIRSRAFDS